MGLLDIFSTLVNSAVDHAEKTIEEQQRKIEIARQKNGELGVHRRTDAELEMDGSGIDMSPSDYQYQKNVRLSEARNIANGMPGVYVLYLDDRARRGDYWSVTEENRDHIMVSWQCCPVSKCKELEYKLFRKYGKGIWAKRAPQHCDMDTWELLI